MFCQERRNHFKSSGIIMQNLKVTLIQSALHWQDPDANLNMFEEKIASIREATDLIILPEMFSTGFTMEAKAHAQEMKGEAVAWMKKMAVKKNCVITGSLIIKEENNFYNRLIWMRADGSFEQYDKRHLFRMANEQEHYAAGKKKLIVDLNGWRFCPQICYDLRFPVWSRNGKEDQQYDCLIYVANWPERRSYPWKQLLLARAIENQAYVVAVNRIGEDGNGVNHSGDSVAIDPKGEIISDIKASEACIQTVTLLYQELVEFRKAFPVGMDADDFEVNS